MEQSFFHAPEDYIITLLKYLQEFSLFLKEKNCFTLRRADINIKLVTKITAATMNENNENNINKFLTKTLLICFIY